MTITLSGIPAGEYFVAVEDMSFQSAQNYSVTLGAIADDFTESVNTTGILTLGGSASAVNEFANDGDWFAITLTAGTIVSFDTDGTFLPIGLHNASGAIIAANATRDPFTNAITVLTETLDFRVVETGQYFVSTGGHNGRYTISATDITARDDYTQDTTTTGRIGIGETITASGDYNRDVDWFAIDVSLGDNFRLTTDTAGARVTLYDASGIAFTSSDASVIYAGSASTTIYVGVELNGHAGDYTLSSHVVSDDHGNFFENATVLVPFAPPVRATEEYGAAGGQSGDADMFRIDAQSGEFLLLSATNPFSGALITLFDDSGQELVSRGISGRSDYFVAQADYTGSYYVRVFGDVINLGVITAASVSDLDDFANYAGTFGPPEPFDYGVVNDGELSSGSIDYFGDSDVFTIEIPMGETATYTLVHNFGSSIRFSAHDANGSRLQVNAVYEDGIATLTLDGSFARYISVDGGGRLGDYTVSNFVPAIDLGVTGNDGDNTLTGTDGADLVNGFGGADTLDGGAGDDILNGGMGSDILTGGAGLDRFVFSTDFGSGADRITDFTSGVDLIEIGSGFDTFEDVIAAMTGFDGYVVLDIGNANFVRIDNMRVEDFTFNDFRMTDSPMANGLLVKYGTTTLSPKDSGNGAKPVLDAPVSEFLSDDFTDGFQVAANLSPYPMQGVWDDVAYTEDAFILEADIAALL